MPFITNKDEILAVPVLDVLQKYLPELTKKGANWVCNCPIHGEKTASFTVSPSKNIWKCFGCGNGGSAVDFLMENPHTNLTFFAALQEVALIAGIALEFSSAVDAKDLKEQYIKEKADKERLVELMTKAHQFYQKEHAAFFTEKDGKIDVLGKVFKKETFDKFGIVYAPGNAALYQHAKKEKWNLLDCVTVGLIKQNENGYYDFFNDRVLFPIQDHRGNIVAFGGKAVKKEYKGKKLPKYINSPESIIYNKSEQLYGLYQTKRAIRNAEIMYMVEGYTDVISMWENEVQNVVASCGTALTKGHCELIKRFTRTSSRDGKVISLRDGDKAGIKSAAKDVEILVENNIMVEVAFLAINTANDFIEIRNRELFKNLLKERGNEKDQQLWELQNLEDKYSFLPIQHDPDSYLRAYDRTSFLDQIQYTKQDGIMWRTFKGYEKDDLEKEENTVRIAGKLLSFIRNEMRRDRYLKKMVKIVGKPTEKYIKEEIGRNEEKLTKTKTYKKTNTQDEDLRNYRFYISKNNQYMDEKDSGDFIPMSNCVIHPLYHVAARENPTRVVKIINTKKEYFTVNLPTSDFVSLSNIEAKLAEFGNFMLYTDGRGWKRILRKLYDEMPTVYQITTLGHHNKGFYTWNNGIGYGGDFFECNQNGIVNFSGLNFLLPGYDFMKDEDNRFDDSANTDEYIDLFSFRAGECLPFEDWTKDFVGVFGENGLMGVGYYLASLYRDIIYPKNRFFSPPILLWSQRLR